MMLRVFVIVSVFWFTLGLRLPQNHTAVLISKYAKVAKWGTNTNANSNNTNQGYARSHSAVWSPRSNSNSNHLNQVVYQYPVYRNPSEKEDNDEIEIVPGIGEVIQDRFQVRPYFGYGKQKDSAITYLPPKQPDGPPPTQAAPPAPPVRAAPVAPVPQIVPPTFPASNFNAPIPASSPSPPSNLYNSPFSSYNPPSAGNPDNNDDVYPPNAPPSQASDSFSSSGKDVYLPNAPPSQASDSFSSSGKDDSYASAPQTDDGIYNYQPAPKQPEEMQKPSGTYGSPAPAPSGPDYQADSKPPNHPPKSIDDVFYPPDFPEDQLPEGYRGHDAPTMDMIPQDDHKNQDIMDLMPPVAEHDFPKYLYDDHHYDHHVYEEVIHKTTTPAPEKKRVSTTNYSYYYLGRKLWYVPLYFSIYFMVYVTALIIKSIARHKVTLRNEWITANSRSGREMAIDHIEAINDIHRNITTAIDKADKMYSGLAM